MFGRFIQEFAYLIVIDVSVYTPEQRPALVIMKSVAVLLLLITV